MQQFKIDAKKEFGASVEASLFVCKTGEAESVCKVYDFYTTGYERTFGWTNHKFVSNIETYNRTSSLDGVSPLQWWSGIKHDCQPVVELTKREDGYYNKLEEQVNIEEDLIYPYVKSSDIQSENPTGSNRYVIVTQRKVSDNTEQLQYTAPRKKCCVESVIKNCIGDAVLPCRLNKTQYTLALWSRNSRSGIAEA